MGQVKVAVPIVGVEVAPRLERRVKVETDPNNYENTTYSIT
jgi:hypothetical protein